MKKIGILTFHSVINYGAYLQSYSLSQMLKRTFPLYDIEIIDYISPKERKKIYKNIFRELKNNGVTNMFREFSKVAMFKKQKKVLPVSNRYLCTYDIESLYEYINDNYCCLIIGSDAVLNWNQNGFPSAYYPDKCCRVPVLGYALSVHGLKYKELEKFRYEYCKSSMDKFEFIGYRDNNTKEFIDYVQSRTAKAHICDPTFLICLKDVHAHALGWANRLKNKYKFDYKNKYIVLMVNEDKISKQIYEVYHDKYKIISLFKYNKNADLFLYEINPFEWVEVLANAEIVFTQYFHGALLTLKTGTLPIVIDVADNTEYESKLHDVMCRRLGLYELYFNIHDFEPDKSNLIFNVAERWLNGEYKNIIKKAVQKEKMSYKLFVERLSDILHE